ncbi:hypothetical protein [Pseudomonas urmiensis]|uniref:Uncharacterized protein n=1 Tax=Pseudomonas urmiensis TaxID=2745493 RepID=A0A923FUB2_9PSED|nr:hypothetical protein [Pseudomonas urmiensis]MBV4538602.1 hypothetical protein [Pseudomonas urmiensis]
MEASVLKSDGRNVNAYLPADDGHHAARVDVAVGHTLAQALQSSIGDATDLLALPVSKHHGLPVLVADDDFKQMTFAQLLDNLFLRRGDLSSE